VSIVIFWFYNFFHVLRVYFICNMLLGLAYDILTYQKCIGRICHLENFNFTGLMIVQNMSYNSRQWITLMFQGMKDLSTWNCKAFLLAHWSPYFKLWNMSCYLTVPQMSLVALNMCLNSMKMGWRCMRRGRL